MAQKIWIEAALNGPWSRRKQPGIPDTVGKIVEEGIACAKAGAAIVHVHAYDDGGDQVFDWQVYARIIEGIRAEIDVPVYPSIPSAGLERADAPREAAARFAHTEELARRGLLEFAVVDPGSVNFSLFGDIPEGAPGMVYANPEADVRHGLRFAVEHDFHPAYAIYEPGFTRLGAALAQGLRTPVPIYRFMFSDEFAWGFPPKPEFLDAHIALLEQCQPGAPWMIAGLGVDIRPLIGEAVRRGGHVRVGLEDAPFGCEITNLAWVEAAVRLVRDAGGEPATVAEMRRMLKD